MVDAHFPGFLMVQVVFPQDDFVRQLPEKAQGLSGRIIEHLVLSTPGEKEDGDFMLEAAENSCQLDLGPAASVRRQLRVPDS